MDHLGDMERPLRLVLIRHGESARNQAKGGAVFLTEEGRQLIAQVSDVDNPLTENGWRQARETGAALRERFGVPDCIYHSGYQRTADTTAGILSAYDAGEQARIEVSTNIFIRERDTGYTFNMTSDESTKSFPWLQEYWQTYRGFYARPPGGQSFADVVQRVYLFLDMLFRAREGRVVFAVTHGGTMRCFRFLLERWTHSEVEVALSPANCGVTVYNYDQARRQMVLEEFNSVCWQG